MEWYLITKMTTKVGRKSDMCVIFDITLNHRYFPIMKYVQQAAYKELCSIIWLSSFMVWYPYKRK